jgi:glycosyltransferase involved in cell wall biosynthesis
MAVYNGARFLAAAVDSILMQSYEDFELLLVDDASTDETPGILDRVRDPRLIRLHNASNLGLTRSLNRGLTLARGTLVARHDADDLSAPTRFAQQIAFMHAHPEVSLLGSDYEVIDTHGRVLDQVSLPEDHRDLSARLSTGNVFCHGSVMLRRAVLQQVGGYNPAFPVTQDYDLWLRIAELSEIANLPLCLYRFRFDEASISRQKRALQLSYSQLALNLAEQRRNTGQESGYPTDVVAAFPPDPLKLFLDARGTAYLYYAADQPTLAAQALARAGNLIPQLERTIEGWDAWALSRGNQLAQLRHDASAGEEFIRWIYATLEGIRGSMSMDQTLARYYADQAFLCFDGGRKQNALRFSWQAMQHDQRWLRNRGLWSIWLKSLAPQARKTA